MASRLSNFIHLACDPGREDRRTPAHPLRQLPMPLPPLPLQQEFLQRISAIETLKATQLETASKLAAFYSSLQQRAFRGELDPSSLILDPSEDPPAAIPLMVEVEVNAGAGLPQVVVVGLPDASVKESRDRGHHRHWQQRLPLAACFALYYSAVTSNYRPSSNTPVPSSSSSGAPMPRSRFSRTSRSYGNSAWGYL